MSAAAGDRVPPELRCGNCGHGMRRLLLQGHYGREVELDLCGGCHLIWFDTVESARLGGPALLELIGAMAQVQPEPHNVLHGQTHCPRCRGSLKTVHNQSRFGRSLMLECRQGHGAYQTFSQFLSEKGLIRPMSLVDRAALLKRDGHILCLNCGAALNQDDETCSYCGTQPGMFDLARLAKALDPEGATAGHRIHQSNARHARRECLACGAPMPEGGAVQCAQCGATLAISRLADVHARVAPLAEALIEHARKPAAHIVEKRLDAAMGSSERHKEFAREMEQQAAAARGGGFASLGGDSDRNPFEASPLEIVFAIVALLLAWWLWH